MTDEEIMRRYEVRTYIVNEEKTLYSIDTTEAPMVERAITNVKYKLFGSNHKGDMCSFDGGHIFHQFEFVIGIYDDEELKEVKE